MCTDIWGQNMHITKIQNCFKKKIIEFSAVVSHVWDRLPPGIVKMKSFWSSMEAAVAICPASTLRDKSSFVLRLIKVIKNHSPSERVHSAIRLHFLQVFSFCILYLLSIRILLLLYLFFRSSIKMDNLLFKVALT